MEISWKGLENLVHDKLSGELLRFLGDDLAGLGDR